MINNEFLKDKRILITGISGYLGSNLLHELLKYDVHSIRGVSRNESKLSELKEKVTDDRVRLYIGDIRDSNRMQKAVEDVDIIYHCAALKHISLCERNTFEATSTNIIGSQNLIDLAILNNIEQFISIDSDKSCNSINYYGSTKKIMRQLTINANFIKGSHSTKFSCMRWGNILNSNGSVLPKWKESIKNSNSIKITNPLMTRFNLCIEDVIKFMIECQQHMVGGEIFIPEMKSYLLKDLAEATIHKYGNKDTNIIKINDVGYEKLHEELLDTGEGERTYLIDKGYVVLPENTLLKEFGLEYNYKNKANIEKYLSFDAEKLTIQELKEMI